MGSVNRIIVLGGSGYIGEAILNFGNSMPTATFASASRRDINGYATVNLNYNSLSELVNFFSGADVVINAMGLSAAVCEVNKYEAYLVNYEYVKNILNAADVAGVNKLIQLSTVHVNSYPFTGIIDEIVNSKNLTAYGNSKLAADDFLLGCSLKSDLEIVILRLSNLFGSPLTKNSKGWDLVVNNFIKQAVFNNSIVIRGNPLSKRDFVNITDFLHLIELLILEPKVPNSRNIYNVSSRITTSIVEIAHNIASEIQGLEVISDSSLFLQEPDFIIDNSKLVKKYNIKFSDIQTSLKNYLVNFEL